MSVIKHKNKDLKWHGKAWREALNSIQASNAPYIIPKKKTELYQKAMYAKRMIEAEWRKAGKWGM